MIKFEHTEIVGWEAAIRGMRNPMNSWEKSDSMCEIGREINIGKNDWDLMCRLRIAGTDHRKFMRMITVYVDITAPLYWFKEFDTYKVGTVANSCSTMHKIADKKFRFSDFSCEHIGNVPNKDVSYYRALDYTIMVLNDARQKYLETHDKAYWWQMIQLLPSSYNQKRTVMLNYEVLANIYKSRNNHKLDEWRDFCNWIEELPFSELITGNIKEAK